MINKEVLIGLCKKEVQDKLTDLQTAIDGYKKDLLSETKSSAGDKHETGRAMLQLEMEKLGQQFLRLTEQYKMLEKLKDDVVCSLAQIGAVVETNYGIYFLANSLGVVNCNNEDVFVISINSPIGKLLLRKEEGVSFSFQSKNYTILKVY